MDDACPAAPAPARSPIALTPSQWWCVLKGVHAQADRANLGLIAAGMAYLGLTAALPGLAGIVTLFGLFGDPRLVGAQIQAMHGVAPDSVIDIVYTEAMRLMRANHGALIAGGAFNVFLSLWSALQGTRVALLGLSTVNRRAEKRSFLRYYIVAGIFTLVMIGLALFAILLMGAVPLVLAALRLDAAASDLVLLLRWPVLGGAGAAVALMLYRWGPRRRPPAWRWLWPGGFGAPLLWVLASSALTWGLRVFPSFGAAYGSLASFVALLLWFYVTSYIFLLGGALNAELEFFAAGAPTQPAGEHVSKPPSVKPSKR